MKSGRNGCGCEWAGGRADLWMMDSQRFQGYDGASQAFSWVSHFAGMCCTTLARRAAIAYDRCVQISARPLPGDEVRVSSRYLV